ncbi:MAG: hypothetical protein RLZZ230_647 [Candidatus Parcubacteria bacterium]|jgi:mRNA-degrading endonuclease RelE of RelBE toxin-antitoxin system
MSYEIIITDRASQDLKKLDTVIRKRVGLKLRQAALLDDLSTVAKHLTGEWSGAQRLRVGYYRVLFEVFGTNMVILKVQHRKDVYKK